MEKVQKRWYKLTLLIKIDHFQFIFSISFDQFLNFWYDLETIQLIFCDICFGFQEFGSKMSIKWQLGSDSSWNLALSWFNCPSLLCYMKILAIGFKFTIILPIMMNRCLGFIDSLIVFFQIQSKFALSSLHYL